MIAFAPAIPYILGIIATFKIFRRAKKTIDIARLADDVHKAVSSHQEAVKEKIEVDGNALITDIQDFVLSGIPAFNDEYSISLQNPQTMPDYLQQQNELIEVLIEKTNNSTAQAKFQNELLSRSIEAQIVMNANTALMSETISASLPAMVIQLNEVAKIAGVLSVKTDIETAYAEQSLTNHAELIDTLNGLSLGIAEGAINVAPASVSVTVPDTAIANLKASTDAQTSQMVETNNHLLKVSQNAEAQKLVAEHLTTVAQITRMDGSIYAELTPLELSTQKDVSLVEAKIKEKEIADYQTTAIDIINLDGNVVATMKPMEATAVKEIVDAKNATDEMEFELDDDILDEMFKPLVLPEYTSIDVVQDNIDIYNNWSVPNG